MQSCSFPFFFSTKRIGYPAGDDDSRMNPFARFSSRYSRRAWSSFSEHEYTSPKVGCFPSCSGIVWSHGWCLGSASGPLVLVKRFANCWYFLGRVFWSSHFIGWTMQVKMCIHWHYKCLRICFSLMTSICTFLSSLLSLGMAGSRRRPSRCHQS